MAILWTFLGCVSFGIFVFWAVIYFWSYWGATPEERSGPMPGEELLPEDRGKVKINVTRAVSIDAPPDVTWRWLEQWGRGAGFYSYDRLDNGGKTSARHLIT